MFEQQINDTTSIPPNSTSGEDQVAVYLLVTMRISLMFQVSPREPAHITRVSLFSSESRQDCHSNSEQWNVSNTLKAIIDLVNIFSFPP
mmetsp:Transcript_27895/g.42518  ORF Transcript_27895/g.42518 Transcript_27895/m.42518 type:complete len:89 (+) Transcript_27895:266-532(+)